MLQLSKLMSCLYDCIYISLKYQGIQNSLEVVTTSLGFSVEATIKSRSWLICGQSDIDYYAPRLNRGYEGSWKKTSYSQLRNHLCQVSKKGTPLIVETDARLMPYYQPGSLEIGGVHAFVILDWDENKDEIYVYDRLASQNKIKRDSNHAFKTRLSDIAAAMKSYVYIMELDYKKSSLSWSEEVESLLAQSVKNMTGQVTRSHASYQCFGLEAIRLFADTLGEFSPAYREDTQSTWLLSYTIPMAIFQSVYGNRILLKKALRDLDCAKNRFDSLISSINESLTSWDKFRKECVLCAQNESTYENLRDCLLKAYDNEALVVDSIKSVL